VTHPRKSQVLYQEVHWLLVLKLLALVVTCFVLFVGKKWCMVLILYGCSFKSFVDLRAEDFKTLVWVGNWCKYFQGQIIVLVSKSWKHLSALGYGFSVE
jgi:hypothetical protein